MKWFTATNESSLKNDSFFELLAAAVLSARDNTSLDSYLLYEGKLENKRIEWLEEKGVTILPHELSFRDEIESFCKKNDYRQYRARFASGAYLRSELPEAVVKSNIDDNFILYTDCDVIFNKNPNLESVRPHKFAAYGKWEGGYTKYNFGGIKHYNSGVMVMNVKNMYEDKDGFIEFVLENGSNVKRPSGRYWQKNLLLDDQLAWNLFYDKKEIDDIREKYNWSPSSGINKNASIIHFYGIKWNQVENLKQGKLDKPNFLIDKFEKMYKSSKEAYDHYHKIAKSILSGAHLPVE